MKKITVSEEKKTVRREALSRRALIFKDKVSDNSCLEALYAEIWDFIDRKNVDIILCYVNYNKELPTLPFIEEALKKGKRVFCPLSYPDGNMDFFEITSINELSPGFHGIPEPKENGKCYEGSQKALMLLPGAAFDRKGHRIGYGGGYYDRYLKRMEKADIITAGLCFEEQLYEELPFEEHDMKVETVLWL